MVNFCVSGIGKVQKPDLPVASVTEQPFPETAEFREVYFAGDWVATPIHDRAVLQPGMAGTGPMVIQEFGSTTVVFPGQSVTVDGHGIMIITKAS